MIQPDGIPGVAFGTAADGDPRTDIEARSRISSDFGIPVEWAWVRQVHGADVSIPAGPGIGPKADALITTDPSLPIAVSVADCVPVALVAAGAAGLAHAGWRGAAAGVVEATVKEMTGRGHPPHTAVVGPGIGPCCFEVGPEVAAVFPGHIETTTWGTRSVDLGGAISARLDVDTFAVAGCTHHENRFHSYRRDGTDRRQFGVVWVPPA